MSADIGGWKKKPEILAPAGSTEALKAAVAAGCDAVYMGGSRFGARAYAQNADTEGILDAIRFCHLHGVKLYLTVNTLLKNRELKELEVYLLPFYEAGLDAVLVQDMGVLVFIHDHFRELPVHASTQMTITQGRTAGFLKQYHVTRIVPARELSLMEIKEMRRETDLELEIFVHGALCYCYSGICLFSSMLGDRSGNRGRCAQPCRKMYQWMEGGKEKKAHLLSPKELCCLDHIGDLMAAGVDSFKIEGRMKRPEYVALVTAMYRKYVDLCFSLGQEKYAVYLQEHKTEWASDRRKLLEIYNREGFTAGYLMGDAGMIKSRHPGEKGSMMSLNRPGHGGIPVGKVLSVDPFQVTYRASEEIHAQDVVEFRTEEMIPLYEYTLGKNVQKDEVVTARYKHGAGILPGDMLYRTKNSPLLAGIREKFLERRVQAPVHGIFKARTGQKMELTVVCREVTAKAAGDVCQPAKKHPATGESTFHVLNKTGESDFYFQKLDIEQDEGLFLNVGALKQLRREAFANLKEQILSRTERKQGSKAAGSGGGPETDRGKTLQDAGGGKKIAVSVMTREQLQVVLGVENIRRVYLQAEGMMMVNEGEAWSTGMMDAFWEIRKAGKSAWFSFPAVFREPVRELYEKEWKREDGIFSLPWDGFLLRNLESYLFVREHFQTGQIAFDSNCYGMNDVSLAFWKTEAAFVTLPLELTGEEIRNLHDLSACELIIYGKVPLMVSAQCVRANTSGCFYDGKDRRRKPLYFQDERGRRFLSMPVCRYCYNMIYGEEPIYLQEVLKHPEKYPVHSFRYVFTTETAGEVSGIFKGEPLTTVQSGHFYQGIL